MKIVEPSVEIITEPDPLKRIELCGRVCYKSEDKITLGSARGFVERIIKSGHTSVLEHARVKVPWGAYTAIAGARPESKTPYGHVYRRTIACDDRRGDFFQINVRDFIAFGGTLDELETFKNADDYLTARFICDRGISHELVRHRVFSFSQESTRYVNYYNRGMEFIQPRPFEWDGDVFGIWYKNCVNAEDAYLYMLRQGCTPQEARSVLPNSLKTELVMTGTFEQWNAMLKLRLDKSAHPQIRYLMKLLLNNPECPKMVDRTGIDA